MTAGARELLRPEDLQGISNMGLIARTIVEGSLVGLHRSDRHGFSMEFAEYREYSRGDDLRYFDWKAFGRSDRNYIKKFHSETNLRCELIVDASGSMAFGEPCSKLRYASCLAAALAHILMRQQDAVGLSVVADGLRRQVPAARGPAHLRAIFDVLEGLKAESTTDMVRVLHDLAGIMERRGLVILFSDLYEDEEEVVNAVRHFRFRGHEVIVFHLLDPAEKDFDFDRLHDFVDLETGEKLEVHGPACRGAYRRRVARWIDEYRAAFDGCRAEYVLTDTSHPFSHVLADYLHRRHFTKAKP